MVIGFEWVICNQFSCSEFSVMNWGDVCVENEWIGDGREEVEGFCITVSNWNYSNIFCICMTVFMVERRFLIPVKYDSIKALGTLANQHFLSFPVVISTDLVILYVK